VHARDVIERYKKTKTLPQGGADVLWAAKKVLDTTIHPDTGEKIPLPFRVSAFVPMNTLITFGMLLPGAGLANQVFWQWINQSYNLCLNHANRNASNHMSYQEIAGTYFAAVIASCGAALGLGWGVKKATFLTPAAGNIVNMMIPFVSVTTAGLINVFLMRRNEIIKGINVKTSDGTVMAKSQKAGLEACKMVALSRVVTAVPVLTVVPLLNNYLRNTTWMKARRWLEIPIYLSLLVIGLQAGLPFAIALFPQTVQVPVTSLESQFHNVVDPASGKKLDVLYYNRGL